MTKQVINIGTAPNAKNGDALRTAFEKTNANFTELYSAIGADVQIPVQTNNGGKYLTTDGTTLSWSTVVAAGGTGLAVSDFGEGFSLNGANKIVTNKLYSTNLTQSTQHYRLELDTNGVVHLPDQSIINGATLKSVAGNYAGITAGPVGKDEDSWMWVDNNGAWVGTDYSTNGYTWQFDNTGKLTFPGSLTVANGVIGKASTETNVVEDLAGTTTTTHTVESQIEIETTGIVIAKRIIDTYNDGIINAIDSGGSVVELTQSNATIKHYENPEGPNNNVYRQFTTVDGAIIETVQEDVGSVTFGRVNASLGSVEISAGDGTTSKGWLFDNDGVLSLPAVFPTGFTAVLDSAHMVDAVAFEGDLWEFDIEFSLTGNGQVETVIGNNVAWPSNPGYVTGYAFEYTEADHGIPNYTFTLELTDVQHPGDFIYTANLGASNPPSIPNSITSFGATKVHGSNSVIVANGNGIHEERFTFAGRNLILPGNGDIKDYLGNSVLGGVLQYVTKPSSRFGQAGDIRGQIAIDSNTGDVYICINNYTDGLVAIWTKQAGDLLWNP